MPKRVSREKGFSQRFIWEVMEEDSKIIDYILYSVIGTGLATLVFLFYLLYADNVPSAHWAIFSVVPVGLIAGILCIWLAAKAQANTLGERDRRIRIRAFGGEPSLIALKKIEVLLNSTEESFSQVEEFLASEVQQGNLSLRIPGSALQSFELAKRYIEEIKSRRDVAVQLLSNPTEKTVKHSNSLLRQAIELDVDQINSIVFDSELPAVPIEEFDGTIRSLLSQIIQHVPEFKQIKEVEQRKLA